MGFWQIDSCRCTEHSGPGTRDGASFRGKQVSVQLLAVEDYSTRSFLHQQQHKVCFPSSLPGHPASHNVHFILFRTGRTGRLLVGPIIPARGFSPACSRILPAGQTAATESSFPHPSRLCFGRHHNIIPFLQLVAPFTPLFWHLFRCSSTCCHNERESKKETTTSKEAEIASFLPLLSQQTRGSLPKPVSYFCGRGAKMERLISQKTPPRQTWSISQQ